MAVVSHLSELTLDEMAFSKLVVGSGNGNSGGGAKTPISYVNKSIRSHDNINFQMGKLGDFSGAETDEERERVLLTFPHVNSPFHLNPKNDPNFVKEGNHKVYFTASDEEIAKVHEFDEKAMRVFVENGRSWLKLNDITLDYVKGIYKSAATTYPLPNSVDYNPETAVNLIGMKVDTKRTQFFVQDDDDFFKFREGGSIDDLLPGSPVIIIARFVGIYVQKTMVGSIIRAEKILIFKSNSSKPILFDGGDMITIDKEFRVKRPKAEVSTEGDGSPSPKRTRPMAAASTTEDTVIGGFQEEEQEEGEVVF